MTITRVQGQATNPTGYNTSWTGFLPSGVAQGNLLIAEVAVGNNATGITGPTGWARAVINQPAGTNATIETSVWWTIVSASQVGQTSWGWSLTESHTVYIALTEWHSTNGWPTNPVDKVAQGDTSGTPTKATAILSGTTATTTQASELWVASLAYKDSAQAESAITAGWTRDLEATLANNNTMTALYQIAIATGAAACQYTIGTAEYWAGVVATFKDNAAGIVPQITTTPTTLSFGAPQNGANPASQNSTLAETNGAATNWTSAISYHSGAGWLAISPTSGSLSANGTTPITFLPVTGALAAGTYTATVTFTATTGGTTATVDVTFTIQAARLTTAPTALVFTAFAGGDNPVGQSNTLAETAGVATGWTSAIAYGAGSGWLAVSPASGSLLANGLATLTISVTTGALAVGTYSATITFTAAVGGATAALAVTFTVRATGSFQILLAGQDITNHMDQMSLDMIDALGQASGAGSSARGQGRVGTIKFRTDLGPITTARGAGQALPGGGPYLVRQGKLIIRDAQGNTVWGGFATKLTDITTGQYNDHGMQPFTTIEGTDYEAALDRIMVNVAYSAQTDVQIIQQVLQQYAPWIDQTLLPATGTFLFPAKVFRNISVLKVIQTVAGITGYMTWVDFSQAIHYVSPSQAQTSPFGISDKPDFLTTFPHHVQEYIMDDNAAINRVTFYGGRKNSGDFTQDVSPLANGNNTVFSSAYYPHPSSDGKWHVTVNSVQQVIGDANGAQTPANILKSAGGLADVLVNADAHSYTFSTAPANGATVKLIYQYDYQMTIMVADENSHTFFGSPYLDGYISDNTVFDTPTAIQRCKVLLSQQSFGLVSLKIDVFKPGLKSGQIIRVTNALRGLNGSYLIQEVETEPYGGGNFVYHLTLGAWNWNILDILAILSNYANVNDQSNAEATSILAITQVPTNVNVTVSNFSTITTSSQPYYARAAAVGDGHDAYPGFATISS